MTKHTAPFDWSGGHPALDFVNTLDERSLAPVENLGTYRDLVQFAQLAGLLSQQVAKRLRDVEERNGASVARRARQLREQLHRILAAGHTRRRAARVDVDAVGKAILAAHAARRIMPDSSSLAKYTWKAPVSIDVPLHACALAIERLLLDVDRDRTRKCRSSDCDVYFIDMSKGHRRQWCSMRSCGNREKQRRWRSGEK